jgi:hypothetical protein
MKFERAKTVSFVVLLGMWTYFRHYLNLVMLYSIWTEFDTIPYVSSASLIFIRRMADVSAACTPESTRSSGRPRTASGWCGG